jgi:hypothetical protein
LNAIGAVLLSIDRDLHSNHVVTHGYFAAQIRYLHPQLLGVLVDYLAMRAPEDLL